MSDELIKEAEAIIASIDIPTQPQVLINIYNEVMKPEPDFRKLKEFVNQDIGMAARIIKIANSAFFGLRYKVHSIEHALTIMGLENFTNIICTSSLRDALMSESVENVEFETIFNHSMHVARISQFITHKARIFSGGIIFPSQTYMVGLFHDCGILILAKKYQDYFEKIKSSLSKGRSLVEIEEDLFRTNHYIVGYVVTKSWQLPDIVCQVIQHHHNPDIKIHTNLTLKNMLAINMLAEGVITKLLESENSDESTYGLDVDSKKLMADLLDELNFDKDDFKDILETAKEITENE